MGLSSAEKEGCRQMLFLMEVSDLLALYKTVSKTETPVRVKAEIIEKIIQESNNAEELLHRKRVYRHIIVQYLNNQHIFIYANSTKEKAIETVLHLWRKSDTSVNVECNTAASGSAVAQLSIQINGLSIQNSQEDSNPVDKAWLLAAGDAQTTDSNAFALLYASTSGTKPKVKPAPRKSQSTTVSVTVSVTSQQNSNGLSYATKGPRKQKQ
ncbi:uncharacterized protein LOC120927821 isoform X2 [Rana temporaria]|uniref:uncharacterized protein LOC120927816 isoform X2 n=1 Tax=Rana temporaria TaxID=8407 RepID=UPI001AACC875|nr:uncharacterized protein LOC120927816 isoform X2 [Rana temporaria]XP_040194677.1 uncharacterized protein LOC120927821 isoform X2 [Rana temporaria]